MEKSRILVVDDDKAALSLLKQDLEAWGYEGVYLDRAKKALDAVEKEPFDLIISDQVMPDMPGLELLNAVKKKQDIPFIIVTAFGSIDNAVQCIKEGAYDYILKPYSPGDMKALIERSLDHRRLKKENIELKSYISSLYGFQRIIHKSDKMAEAIRLAEKVAASPHTTVIIYGESGTGKELFARAIHTASGCLENRFVGVNCAGIPQNILESELFGHVKGAFPGADQERIGKFSMAQNGTVLLDEIGDMPLDVQAKLLRTIEQRVFEKLGSDVQIPVNFRIIVTTHRDLPTLVEDKKFRSDLFHRINAFPINVPPLRERKEDIPLLVEHIVENLRTELGKPIPGVSDDAMQHLVNYHWPGNVRELKNCLERAAIIIEKELIKPKHLILKKQEPKQCTIADKDGKVHIDMAIPADDFSLNAVINRTLSLVLNKCKNNKVHAADMLRINRNMFYRRPLE